MASMIVENRISIHATAARVWDILTRPEETRKYMFGCETVSEWVPGASLLWRGNYEGKEIVFVKGFIKTIEAPSLLVYTVTDPNAAWPDVPENYLNVTYELSEANGSTLLTVRQDGFEHAAEGEKRYKDVYNNGDGWNPILILIKQIAES